MLHHVRGHDGTSNLVCIPKPRNVVLGDPFGESGIGLGALVLNERTHGTVLQFDIPFAERALDSLPFLYRRGRIDHIGYITPLLTVVLLYLLTDNRLLMDMRLEAQEYLAGINRLDQIIGYLLADSLLHDMLLFRFGNHNHRYFGMQTFDLLKRFQSRHSRHVLVQEDDTESGMLMTENFQRILAVTGGNDFVVLLFQINNVRLQQVYLVINPKYSVHSSSIY